MPSLVADVGGTNSRLALVDPDGSPVRVRHFTNAEFSSFGDILASYLSDSGVRPEQAAFAVAGPVEDQTVTMTNLGWQLSASDLARAHDIGRVELMNDFAAQAWGTLYISDDELIKIGGGRAIAGSSRAILGPGTGLGAGGLISTGSGWAAVSGEGGHVTLAAVTEGEQSLITSVTAELGHCSAESLLSGPGLLYIYRFLGGTGDQPQDITSRALDGEPLALRAFDMFFNLLGTVAADLALILGARGGVYLTGGVLPVISKLLSASCFRQRFERKGRMSRYLKAIPVCLVMAEDPALRGLAGYLRSTQKSG
jgi:glucokinase